MASKEEVNQLLADLSAGKKGAEDTLLPLIYNELRALAHLNMQGERPGHTLQTTALVHEAYLKLAGDREKSWESRAHFMRVAAQAMRRVLIDHSRRKKADKKGGGRKRQPLDQTVVLLEKSGVDLLAVDDALCRLAEIDPQMAQVVECRFFGGLTIKETARIMGISPSTVKNDWVTAKSWLRQQFEG